jgi:hypothetical protein
MELPTEADVKECYERFMCATSNESLAMSVCAVCAQETSRKEGDFVCIHEFPNITELLKPRPPNDDQQLWNGMLLHLPSLRTRQGNREAWMCNQCRRALLRERLPKHALANNLWIGCVPPELAILTLPGQLLIVRHYPRCYVFKLYPKAVRAGITIRYREAWSAMSPFTSTIQTPS